MIILRSIDGKERQVPENTPYRLEPGEYIAGSTGSKSEDEFQKAVKPLLSALGIGIADFITLSSKALGIEKCASCQFRDKFLRRMGELGVIETGRRILATFKGNVDAPD